MAVGGALPDGAPLAVGFSGGGDSLYLLTLLRSLLPERSCHALIVDHGIRAGSAADAAEAAQMAEQEGAIAHVLRWDGAPLQGHAAARNARYQLLARGMQRIDSKLLWLAHTQDDQIETFCLRVLGQSGWRGLVGMQALSRFPLWPEGSGLQVFRPLLDMSRAEIRAQLKAHNVRWLDDPANADHRHARVRMRDHLRQLEAAGFDRDRILSAMQGLQGLHGVQDAYVQSALLKHVRFDPLGFAMVQIRAAALPANVLAGVLANVTLAVSGAKRLPHSGTRLCEAFAAIVAGKRKSLNQCLWFVRNGAVWIVRDPGGVCGRVGVPPQTLEMNKANCVGWFDGRWRVQVPGAGTVTALCDRFKDLPAQDRQALKAVPVLVRRTVPVWQGEEGEFRVLPFMTAGACRFAGMMRGMETGKGFA